MRSRSLVQQPLSAALVLSLVSAFAIGVCAQPPGRPAKPARPAAGRSDAQLIAEFEKTSPTRVVERRKLAALMAARTSPLLRDFALRQVRKDRDVSVRHSLIRCLVRTPDRQVREVFEKLLADAKVSYGERDLILRSLPKFSFNWRARLVRFVGQEEHAALRRTAITTLAKSRDDEALKSLRRVLAHDDKLISDVLGAIRSAGFPVSDVYREFIAPYVEKKNDIPARLAAIRVLAQGKDARFHGYARAFAEDVTTSFYLNSLITDAAGFNDVEATITMARLSEAGGLGTADSLHRGLARIDDPESRRWLITHGLAHPVPWIKRAAVKAVAKNPTLDAVKPLQAIVRRSDDVSLAVEALRTLGAIGGPDVRKYLRKRWGAKNPFVAAAAFEASYQVERGGEDVVKALLEVARRSRAWRLRLVAMQILKEKHAVRMFPELKTNAAHKRGQVRAEAYEALTRVRTKECVDFLIARLFHEKGRSRFDLADALLDLTGFDYGIRASTWREWWGRVREGYTLPPKPKKRRRSAPPAGYASYYGIPVRSNRVVFVIDTSGSMSPVSGTGKKSKMQKAQENLIGTIKALESKVGFTVIAFASTNDVFEDELIRASKGNKKKAENWILDLKPGGGTMLMNALDAALAVEKVDTLFVLSDGAPNGDRDEILRIITERNRFDRVRINTIGIQVGGTTAAFMRELAEKNYGEFVQR